MNVLSLFDGISCGKVALERAGLSVAGIRSYLKFDMHSYHAQILQELYAFYRGKPIYGNKYFRHLNGKTINDLPKKFKDRFDTFIILLEDVDHINSEDILYLRRS